MRRRRQERDGAESCTGSERAQSVEKWIRSERTQAAEKWIGSERTQAAEQSIGRSASRPLRIEGLTKRTEGQGIKMFQIGEKQTLVVVKKVPMGVYLREEGEESQVLLPNSQVPEGCKEGDMLEVFLYKDSEDRLIATRKEPYLMLHQVGYLTVREVGRIGAFLDWGLDKDLLLPFHEQPRDHRVCKGQRILCAVYVDKSHRLAATMNVYPWLSLDSPYQKGDMVSGTVYETSDNYGRFVAVDDRYSGLIPKKELIRNLEVGDKVRARVTRVRPDGKLDLALREAAADQMTTDAAVIMEQLEQNNGVLPFTDKADPDLIRDRMQMSKAQFKRAVGRLLKEGKIEITETQIRRKC